MRSLLHKWPNFFLSGQPYELCKITIIQHENEVFFTSRGQYSENTVGRFWINIFRCRRAAEWIVQIEIKPIINDNS